MSPSNGVASDRSTEFVATTGGHETIPAADLLVVAYVLMWGLVLGFIGLSWRRQTRLDARISELEKALTDQKPRR